jgi:hypothetical protein
MRAGSDGTADTGGKTGPAAPGTRLATFVTDAMLHHADQAEYQQYP